MGAERVDILLAFRLWPKFDKHKKRERNSTGLPKSKLAESASTRLDNVKL
jgi:hypothetical protein